jgi:hypothetical protein
VNSSVSSRAMLPPRDPRACAEPRIFGRRTGSSDCCHKPAQGGHQARSVAELDLAEVKVDAHPGRMVGAGPSSSKPLAHCILSRSTPDRNLGCDARSACRTLVPGRRAEFPSAPAVAVNTKSRKRHRSLLQAIDCRQSIERRVGPKFIVIEADDPRAREIGLQHNWWRMGN